jgi:hypothetical protein
MGTLADWGLMHNDAKKCSKCGMDNTEKKNNGCCNDQQKFLKNNNDQKITESTFQLIYFTSIALPVSFVEIPVNYFHTVTLENPNSHSPPRTNGVAVYIRNCTYLI